VPTTQVSVNSSQSQVNTKAQAETSEPVTSVSSTQAKSPEESTLPTSGSSTTTDATRPASTPIASAPIIVVKQPQPTEPYSGQTSWKQYKEYFTRLVLCNSGRRP